MGGFFDCKAGAGMVECAAYMEEAVNANSDARTLADLESRVQELEESLNKTRASAVALRARILAEGLSIGYDHVGKHLGSAHIAEPLPLPDEDSEGNERETEKQMTPLPRITLATLPPQHIMRVKWHLNTEFPTPRKEEALAEGESPRAAATHEGRLRLFGLMNDGSPWECFILYSNLVDINGITLGRESTDANIVLNDPSISRCHLRLSLTDEGVMVEDENSTNGTRVNNKEMDAYHRRMTLNDGDILSVAEIDLKVELL